MRSAVIALVSIALSGGLAASGCEKNNKPPPPSSGRPGAQPESGPASGKRTVAQGGEGDQSQKMFQMMCAVCHGFDGKGHGPGADMLDPKPRDYTDATWQASVTDEYLKKVILEGGAANGKSPAMPGQPQLKDQPEVLDGLVKIIRAFSAKK